MDYLRIGTDYFKKVSVPLTVKESYDAIVKWNKQEIIQDYGKEYLKKIPKYDGFCNIPSHTDYQPEVGGHYNKYYALSHDIKKGSWKNIEKFLRHIFGDQFITGIDYLTILYRYPMQTLPILALVSEERNTGKSTFLQFLKLLFEKNITINTNEDFRSRFNSDWSNKLIIAIDEVLLDKREDSERLKNLSTAKSYKTEAKGKDKTESNYFGKIILCSNNEDNFVLIDSNEIRYWVRKIESLESNDSKPDPEFLIKLKNEIPAFLYVLSTRDIIVPKTTRMWFTKGHIHTPALDRLLKGTTSSLLREIIEVLKDLFALTDENELAYGGKDLLPLLKDNGVLTTTRKVNDVLRSKLNPEEKNGSYSKHQVNYNINGERYLNSNNEKGRHFIFKRDIVESF
ncbi:primase-helicase family protein [Nonlabens sp.]|uniref:primase-helicase family protein n=1 Tax=Nonlabens sp. TaxID=1888209 RepID=UPI0032664928